ncbi:hypothetical protein LZ30DRAFT_725897 [Colletotrichum cereale]|nr:hypothetical protein LZ30DRAFT_725897 [Colletotrichum cereale]
MNSHGWADLHLLVYWLVPAVLLHYRHLHSLTAALRDAAVGSARSLRQPFSSASYITATRNTAAHMDSCVHL